MAAFKVLPEPEVISSSSGAVTEHGGGGALTAPAKEGAALVTHIVAMISNETVKFFMVNSHGLTNKNYLTYYTTNS